MIEIQSKAELRQAVAGAKSKGRRIGFVPTMGFLHEGHLSLMRRARMENDLVVTSVFVNPTQFAPHEDLDTYPRDADRDAALMRAEGVDIAFFPTVETIYPRGYATFVTVEGALTQGLCGRSRPIFFRGVATVVAKLFNLVTPDRAYFGQKDAQQAAVVKQMVRDLNFDLEVVVCPIVRESDGLAMSSRNAYLTPQQRAEAPTLSRALDAAAKRIAAGEGAAAVIKAGIEKEIRAVADAVIDYVEVVDADTMEAVDTIAGKILIAVAVTLGRTRLIDNIQVEV
ncbi:MAG: pantoate--beta-alanine ligase [Desulfosarcinaceae bacterium]|jgi:pantoate--beta-alanine ligase